VFTPALLEVLVLALVLAVVVLLAGFAVVFLRLRRLRLEQRRAFEGVEVDVLAALARHTKRLDGLDAEVARVATHSIEVRDRLSGAFSRFGIVRYDAFEDTGGELSFSLAIMDEHHDGLVLSSINGRTGGRTYLKSVTGGQSESNLSDEERTAIGLAKDGRNESRVVEPDARRWRQPR
jgi:hypothetical protein